MDGTPGLTAKGRSASVVLEAGWVTISRNRVMRAFHPDSRINLGQITAVQFRPATTFITGLIRFSVPGTGPRTLSGLNSGVDDNTVIFEKKHGAEFLAIRDAVERDIAARSQTAPSGSAD